MKVLFLTDGIFPFKIGGMQKHSLILSRLLLQHKIHVHVVHCGGDNYTSDSFFDLFPEDDRGFLSETYLKFPKTDPFPGHYIRENKMYSKNAYLEMENRMGEFDLVYAQGFTGWRFIKEKNKRQFSAPVLVNFHGLEMFQTPPSIRVMAEYTLFKNSVKWNLRNADYVYSFGGKIDEIILGLGISPNRILLQSNGIEEDWLINKSRINNSVRKFVFIGRAERRKGIEELNKALDLLLKDDVSFEMSFIGPVPEKMQLKDPKISYLGEIRDQDEIKAILRKQDCLVCPSHSEGMPTVILEGMASGLAIIGTNVGAIERQIQGNGILLEKIDIEALAQGITAISNSDNDLLNAYKDESINLVKENFLWQQVVAQKISDFDAVLQSTANSDDKINSVDTV